MDLLEAGAVHPALICAPRSDRFSDSLKQCLFLQRLSETGHKARFAPTQRGVALCGNQNCRNCNPTASETLLQLQAVHLGHLEINNQTVEKLSRQSREQFLSGPVSSRSIETRTHEPTQALE